MIFIDLETGGVEPEDPNIEVAAIAVEDWKEIDSFVRKIQFDETKASAKALRINSYNREVWKKHAVSEEDAVEHLGEFLRKHSVVWYSKKTGGPYDSGLLSGHNIVQFDAPRLRKMFGTDAPRGTPENKYLAGDIYRPLDTMQRALWFFLEHPELEKPVDFRLTTLCEYFLLGTEGAHTALADVRLAFRLARTMVEWGNE
jgi:DNA polymerase III epsilon subunit-like protein